MRELVDLARRVSELERRFASTVRHGTVAQVDAAKHLVRIRLGDTEDGEPFLSPWVPYGQIAGALKVHTPPTVGQQMTTISPNGDFRQAVAMPMTWSDANASPSSAGDENVLTFGQIKATLKGASLVIEAGGAKLTISTDKIEAAIGGSALTIESGKITHKSALIETDGETRLDKGDKRVIVEPLVPAARVFAKV